MKTKAKQKRAREMCVDCGFDYPPAEMIEQCDANGDPALVCEPCSRVRDRVL